MENYSALFFFFTMLWCSYWFLDGLAELVMRWMLAQKGEMFPQRPRFRWIKERERVDRAAGKNDPGTLGALALIIGFFCTFLSLVCLASTKITTFIHYMLVPLTLYLAIFVPADILFFTQPWREARKQKRLVAKQQEDERSGADVRKSMGKIRKEILAEIGKDETLRGLVPYIDQLVLREVPRRLEIRRELLDKLPRVQDLAKRFGHDTPEVKKQVEDLERRLRETNVLLENIEKKLLLTLPLILNVKTSIDGGKVFVEQTIADFDQLTKSVHDSVAELEAGTISSPFKELDDELARAQAQAQEKTR